MDKEITYIPYGQDEISQQDLMTSLANGVPGYLDSKRWAKKDKYRQAWLNAYQDIIKGGLVGASNSSGIWTIQHGGEPIDLNTKSNLDREMYQDAAYYIQQQMSRMTPRKKEEEAKKENLDKYDFTSQFLPQIYNNRYGGNENLFASEWENLDARGDNGLRGTDNRRAALIDELTKYKQNLLNNKGKYNFEGTAFKDENDVIGRIDEAIAAINSPDLTDDNPKLNALGLSYNSFFSNGGNDVYGTDKDGQQVTYQQYYENLNKQKELDAKAKEEELKKRKQAAYNNTLFFNRVTNPKMMGQNAVALKEKYKDNNSLFNALQGYAQKDIRTLSPQEQSEVQGAYRYLANQPIDSTTLKNLQSSSSGLYKGAAPNRFRKIKGIDNLVWDSVANQVIQITNRQQQEAIRNQPDDLFANVKTSNDKEQEYLNSKVPGITNAEWKELSAIGLDIASIVNPEAISGSAMATGAAALRHSAKNDSNPDWSLGDYFLQGLDYATGILGGIPLLGDSILGAKTAATLAKATPVLRKIGRLGAWTDLFQAYPDLKEATRKITNGEELTIKDWRAIGIGLRGLISHGRLNRGNRAERRVLEKSGQNVTPENVSSMRGKLKNISQKVGFTRTKPTNTTEVSTIKTTVNGKETDIEISANAKARIQEKVKKAGNSAEARNKAVKEVLKEEGKIKETDKIEVEAPTYRDGKYAPNWMSTSRNLFGTKQSTTAKGADTFDDYVNSSRSYWDRYKYGSNRQLKEIRRRLGLSTQSNTETSENKSETSQQGNTEQKQLENKPTTQREQQYNKATINRYKEHLKGNFSNEKLQSGDYNLNGNNLRVVEQQDGTFNIIYKGDIKGNYQKHQQKELQQKVFDLVKENRKTIDKQSGKSTKKSTAEIGKILQDLKKKGWLKQGGTINTPIDNIIEDFFKNNNI